MKDARKRPGNCPAKGTPVACYIPCGPLHGQMCLVMHTHIFFLISAQSVMHATRCATHTMYPTLFEPLASTDITKLNQVLR